jgi:hypothetical protein
MVASQHPYFKSGIRPLSNVSFFCCISISDAIIHDAKYMPVTEQAFCRAPMVSKLQKDNQAVLGRSAFVAYLFLMSS